MTDRCTTLINKVLFGEHSEEEWKELQTQFRAVVAIASEEEIERLEESGIGEMLSMICPEPESE